MAIGVFVYGAAFGLIADQAGLSPFQALLMSAVVYSGSAQLAALSILAAGPSPLVATIWALMATILVINARYMLFSAALRPWLGHVSPLKAYSSLFVLGDGNWMISMRAYAGGERDAGFVFGSGAAMFAPWVLGTWAGIVASTLAPDPRRLGFDFLMVAFAAAMMSGMAKTRNDLVILLASGAAAVLIAWLGAPNWAPVFAGLFGGGIAYARFSPRVGAR